MDSYIGFAQVYDRLMTNVPYEKWGNYIDGILKQKLAKEESPLVVDLACGTGTMTLFLANKNYDMIGVDISADMLAEAQQKSYEAGHNILFLAQDMRKLDLFGTVDAIVSVCDGINYILTPDEIAAVFKRVRLFLNPAGVFIFDMNTEYKFKNLFGRRSFEAKTENGPAYEWDNNYDENIKINEYSVRFYPDGNFDSDNFFTEIHRQRAYECQDIIVMLNEAGFSKVSACHNYTHEPAKPDSPRITFIAEVSTP
ncbi:MAG: class I SAM-dependent methyltransferase [Firmicutes bacterium]|nr:class I SAM-dependent methyltransferase [Bacillota bacterium]